MPRDPVAHSMVSVHYYSPSTFVLLEKDADWGKAAYTWGTPAEVEAVKSDFLLLKTHFIDKGIPVVLGEFQCPGQKDLPSALKYFSIICDLTRAYGIVPVLWDTGGQYDRRALKWRIPQVGEIVAHYSTSPKE
jgi:endoglucanase